MIWCSRCGVAYEKDGYLGPGFMPQCECAGDPPVDRDSEDWTRYIQRVRDLAYEQKEKTS